MKGPYIMNINYLKLKLQVLLPVLDKVLILGIKEPKQRYTGEWEGESNEQCNIETQALQIKM